MHAQASGRGDLAAAWGLLLDLTVGWGRGSKPLGNAEVTEYGKICGISSSVGKPCYTLTSGIRVVYTLMHDIVYTLVHTQYFRIRVF